jgi:hypothetical protein
MTPPVLGFASSPGHYYDYLYKLAASRSSKISKPDRTRRVVRPAICPALCFPSGSRPKLIIEIRQAGDSGFPETTVKVIETSLNNHCRHR